MRRFCSIPAFLILVFIRGAATLQAAPCDLILSARYVITMSGAGVIRDGAVAIRGERIVAVGPRPQIDRAWQARRRIDRGEAILAPGLVNTHTHAAMSLFRGIADDLNLQDWLQHYIFPAEAKNVSPDFVRWGTRLACLEMMLSGTTTFTDMYYFEDVVAEAAKEAGMRGVLGETIIGFPVADAKTPAASLALTEKFLQRFRRDSLIVPAVAPHSMYTNDEQTLRAARALANRYHAPALIHLSETRKENDDSLAKYHRSPTAFLDSIGFLQGRTVAAHCVWVDGADMKILASRHTGVAHCPSSNMKLASGAAPVVAWLAHGIVAGLGTDGPAGSNNDFDLFEEMDLAAKLQKLETRNPRALPAKQALEMATLGGARALGLDREIGSLEAGKRADIITVDLTAPNAVPIYDAYSQMVYALKASNVSGVVVNGRELVREGRCLTLDSTAVIAKAREYGIRVAQSIATR